MRRFDYDDNEEHREDVDGFLNDDGDITPQEYQAIVEEEQAMQQLQVEIVFRDLNDRLMFRVVRMLEKGFWWRFYSLDTKMKLIEKTYRRMKRITEKE